VELVFLAIINTN